MHDLILYFVLQTTPTAHERDPIDVQEIIQNISTFIHDDPASIIAPFELLLDEEINDDFLRDAIESIAHHYNSQYPGVSMPYQNEHSMV